MAIDENNTMSRAVEVVFDFIRINSQSILTNKLYLTIDFVDWRMKSLMQLKCYACIINLSILWCFKELTMRTDGMLKEDALKAGLSLLLVAV